MENQATISDFVSEIGSGEAPEDTSSEEKLYRDAEWLREQYWEEGLSQAEIGELEGVEQGTIGEWMQKHGIETRSRSEIKAKGEGRYQDADWLRERYWDRNLSQKEIAELEGVNQATIGHWMQEHNIETRLLSEASSEGKVTKLQDVEWLREQYIEKERSTHDIADELEVNDETVRRYLKEYDIERRSRTDALSQGDTAPLRDTEWLREQYINRERNPSDIAEQLNVDSETVRNWLERSEIETRSQSEAQAKGDLAPLRNREWLVEQYINKERGILDIAEGLGLSPDPVLTWLDRHGIETRSQTEAISQGDTAPLRNKEWLREQYIYEGRSTIEIAEKLKVHDETVRRWLENHNIEIRSSVYHPDHLEHPVRSSWELNIANLLVDNDIGYEYESIEIDYRENRTYTPDFVIDDYVIEVKGHIFEGNKVVKKAKAAMEHFDDSEYVVVGTELPADIHIPWEERERLLDLLE